ncbi:MAG: hypothetical protein R3F19_31775 [Verrucomicrobiales bacterium]
MPRKKRRGMEVEKCPLHRNPANESRFREPCGTSLSPLALAVISSALLAGLAPVATAAEELIPLNAEWQYYDSPKPPADQWMSAGFTTKAADGWKTGNAPFAVDLPDTATPIASDGDVTPTTYFRTEFDFADPEALSKAVCYVRVNDGLILYLDGVLLGASGVERPNANDPGKVGHNPGSSFSRMEFPIPPGLPAGRHTLAAVVFQNPQDPQRMVFDLSLVSLARGALTEVLIEPRKGDWKYFDETELPASNWNSLEFNASSWKSGPGVLGYGDPDIATTLDFGTDSESRPMTAWFRREFELTGKDRTPVWIGIQFLRDDGAVIYINGIEMVRQNMPDGPIDPSTPAVDTQNNRDEMVYHFSRSTEATWVSWPQRHCCRSASSEAGQHRFAIRSGSRRHL